MKAKILKLEALKTTILASLSVAAWSGAALAQSDDASEQQAASRSLDEVVVTARKKAETLQSVPVSAFVTPGDDIANRGVTTIQDLSRSMPAVQFSKGTTSNRQIIRGVGSGDNPAFEQSVGTFVDEIYKGRARTSEAALFDIERVEVLKGPQTTYFGANAIAGAVNILTRDPGDAFEGNIRALYNPTFDGFQVEAGVSIPLTDTFSVRVAGQITDTDGWIEDVNTGEDYPKTETWAVRATALWEPTDNFAAKLKFTHTDEDTEGGWPIVRNFCPPDPAFGAPAGFCATALSLDADTASGDFIRNTSDGQEVVLETNDLVASLDYDAGSFAFSSVTTYTDYTYNVQQDLDLTPLPLLNWEQPEDYWQFSQELRITSTNDSSIEYLAGLYYQTAKLEPTTRGHFLFLSGVPPLAPLAPYGPLAIQNEFVEESDVYSAFGALTVHATDRLSLTGAIRYSVVEKDFHREIAALQGNENWDDPIPFPDSVAAVANGFAAAASLAVPGVSDLSRSDDAVSGSVSVEYEYSSNGMVYGRYDHGFKAGGFNGVDLTSAAPDIPFAPEYVDSFEIGSKMSLLDGRGILNIDFFRSKYSDLQLSSVVPTTSGAFVNRVQNAGGAVSKGVEAEGRFLISDTLTTAINMAYIDAKYTTFANATPTSLQVAQSIPFQDLSGEVLPNAPKFSASWTLDWEQPITDDLTLVFSNLLYYKGEHFIAQSNETFLQQGSFWREDLTLSLESDNGWSLSFIAKNLTDETIYTYGAAAAASLGQFVYFTEPPRSFAIQVQASF